MVRRDEPNIPDIHGKWELPGGKIEFGESPASTVEREFLEETGVVVEAQQMLPFPYVAIRKRGEQLLSALIFCFRCLPKETKLTDHLPSKVAEARWFDFSEIDPLKVQSGTLQFLRYQMQVENIVPSILPTKESIGFISLESIDAHCNGDRIYEALIIANLQATKTFKVQCTRGRLYSQRKSFEKYFETRDELVSFLNSVIKIRHKHRYRIARISSNIASILPINDYFDGRAVINNYIPIQGRLF
jgi:ADP-ribose pyrophosphatase YjhB (NUDIX family)